MSNQNSKAENTEGLYKDSVKGARIYELILENINFDKIETIQVEIDELKTMNSNEVLNYIKKLSNKNDNIDGKIDDFTKYFKNRLNALIIAISKELNTQETFEMTNNLMKLSAYYYLFKIKTSNDIQEVDKYALKIDNFVNYITSTKDDYYSILTYLGIIKKNIVKKNKIEMIDRYFNILLYLNGEYLTESLNQFMKDKSSLYPQYKIEMPLISFKEKELKKNMKKIYNILIILQRTETFKTNERFEYFQSFKNQNDLLEDINYILCKQNKKPLVSLDNNNNDIEEEISKYRFDNDQAKSNINEDDLISECEQILENAKKNREQYRTEYKELDKKYLSIINEHKKLLDEHKIWLDNYEKKLKEFQLYIIITNKKINKQNTNILSLKNKQGKSRYIPEIICYSEISLKIIKFFSLSLPEDIIKEYFKGNISPDNVNIITNYIKNYLSSYYTYMKDNNTDLIYVLNKIIIVKDGITIYSNNKERNLEKYIKHINENNNQLGEKIQFIFNNSHLLLDYVFNKNNKIKDNEIRDEFHQKNEEFKKVIKIVNWRIK